MMGKDDTMKIEVGGRSEKIVDAVFSLNGHHNRTHQTPLNLHDTSADISGIGRVRPMCLGDLPFLFQAQT